VTEWREKKPWEKPSSVWGPVLLWPNEQTWCDYNSRLHHMSDCELISFRIFHPVEAGHTVKVQSTNGSDNKIINYL